MHLATLAGLHVGRMRPPHAEIWIVSGQCRQRPHTVHANDGGRQELEQESKSLFKSTSQRHAWPRDDMTFNDV